MDKLVTALVPDPINLEVIKEMICVYLEGYLP